MKFWIVNITSFCNHKCIFCSEWDMHNNPKNIPFDKVIEILDNLKSEWVEGINFMWWECTMRSDLVDILDYCNKKFKFVWIVTNWVMFHNYNLCSKILSKVITFEFSWHTIDKAKFDYLSWSNTFWLFQKSLINIWKVLQENSKLWIVINHVINKVNYKDIPNFVKIANKTFELADRKNRMIALKWTNILGYSIKNKDLLSVTWEKVHNYLNKAIDYCLKNNIYVQVEWFPPCFFKDFFESKFFLINEINYENLYLLNKIDISSADTNDLKKYSKNDNLNDYFNKDIYLRWDINLNKKILTKCKKCLIRKLCHANILFNEDSDLLSNKLVDKIWYPISDKEIKYLFVKRRLFLDNTLK